MECASFPRSKIFLLYRLWDPVVWKSIAQGLSTVPKSPLYPRKEYGPFPSRSIRRCCQIDALALFPAPVSLSRYPRDPTTRRDLPPTRNANYTSIDIFRFTADNSNTARAVPQTIGTSSLPTRRPPALCAIWTTEGRSDGVWHTPAED